MRSTLLGTPSATRGIPDSSGQFSHAEWIRSDSEAPCRICPHPDDHSKNFSYLYDETVDRWSLSPAYDLTWSSTYFGEHTTTVDGNGRDPSLKELLAVGRRAGLSAKRCQDIAEQIQTEARPLAEKYRRHG